MKTIFVDGKRYSLCGEFAELVKAERYFGEQNSGVNLATAIANVRDEEAALAAVRQIFPCALRAQHPEVTWEESQTLIDRSIETDSDSIVRAVLKDIWPAVTAETRAANRSLSFGLNDLAEANEFFQGEAGLILLFAEAPSRLEHVWRAFPCALHKARPELSLEQARALMTLESVPGVLTLLGLLEETVTAGNMGAFCKRVYASSLEQDRAEFVFRVAARQEWPGAGRA